jgi:nitrate reductase NapAB chaperone NapD
MAIAGIVVLTTEERAQAVAERLRAEPRIADVRASGDPRSLAAVLEVSSRDMEAEMTRILRWEGVLAVQPAMISYEDELERGEKIACPPFLKRRGTPPA